MTARQKILVSLKSHNIFYVLISFIVLLLSAFVTTRFLNISQTDKARGATDTKMAPTITIPMTLTITPTPSPATTPTTGFLTKKFYITYYGWPDNDPPGRNTAYPKTRFKKSKHESAGGTGTFKDPITFASYKDTIPIGTIYYVPYIKKYIIMEDQCASCDQSGNHIDIWMESTENNPEKVYECQRNWTRNGELVVVNPSPNLPVITVPLFNTQQSVCNKY